MLRTVPVLFLASILVPGVLAHGASADFEKTDPANDVHEARVTSARPDVGLEYRRVEGHADVDVLAIRSSAKGDMIVLSMSVLGSIRDEVSAQNDDSDNFTGGGFSYNFALDLRPREGPEYMVTYGAGHANLQDRERQQSTPLQATRVGGVLTVWVPDESLRAFEFYEVAGAATQTQLTVQGASYESLSWVDVVGTYPGYEGIDAGGDSDGGFLPAPSLLLLLVVLVASVLIGRPRPR